MLYPHYPIKSHGKPPFSYGFPMVFQTTNQHLYSHPWKEPLMGVRPSFWTLRVAGSTGATQHSWTPPRPPSTLEGSYCPPGVITLNTLASSLNLGILGAVLQGLWKLPGSRLKGNLVEKRRILLAVAYGSLYLGKCLEYDLKRFGLPSQEGFGSL